MLIIKELGIEVETELRPKVKFKDMAIPNGWRLLTLTEIAYIFDNVPEINIATETYEWIEHYSQKMKAAGYHAAATLDGDDAGLLFNGYGFDGFDGSCAFPVRFARNIQKEKQ